MENFLFLYKIKDIIDNKKNINSYAFEFDTYSEMLSYLVADTFYNNEHIEDILVDFLYEATFFGNNEKYDINVKKEIDILLKTEDEIKEGKSGKSVEYDYYKMLKKFNKYSDKKIKEIKKNDDLYNKSNAAKAEYLAHKSIIRYNNLAVLFEIDKVRKDIIKYMH